MSEERYRYEPLGKHDRSSFSSGVEELDRYLHTQAGQDMRRRVAAPFVMLDSAGRLVGYYTLSSYTVRSAEIPVEVAKRFPRYPLLPATLLGRLAISQDFQGKRLGRLLLFDALQRSWRNTAEVGSVAVIAEAISEAAASFYRRYGFEPLADHQRRLFLPMTTVGKLFL